MHNTKLFQLIGITAMLLFCNLVGFSQKVFSDWVVGAGTKGWDIVNDLVCDTAGNVYITGSMAESDLSDKNIKINPSARKIQFIAKFDNGGNLLWKKQIIEIINGYGALLTITNTNNIIIAGGFIPENKRGKNEIKKMDFFLQYAGNSGETIWSQTFSATSLDFLTSLNIDTATGDILIAGYFHDTLQIGNNNYISSGKSDAVFIRFDLNGKLQSVKIFGGKGMDKINAMSVTNQGDVILSGTYQIKIKFNSGKFLEVNKNEQGIFLARLNRAGDCLQVKNICSGKNAHVSSITNDGNLHYIAGYFSDILLMNNQIIESKGSDDVFIVCLDNQFNYRWIKHFGGKKKDRICKIAITNNELFVAGSFCDKLNIDQVELSSEKTRSNLFILSMDTTGKINWLRQAAGFNDDYPKGMQYTDRGYIYITGSYRQTIRFLDSDIQSKGEEDIFIARLENCSLLAPKFKNPEPFCKGRSLTLDAGKGFYAYNWNNGLSLQQMVVIRESGHYSLKLMTKGGCTIFDTVNALEIPNPDPFIGRDTIISDSSKLVLTAGGKFKDYLWSNENKDSLNIIRGFNCKDGTNQVWVKVTDKEGCKGYAEMMITLQQRKANGYSELFSDNCSVFPNPAKDVVSVSITNDFDRVTIIVYDLFGKEITSKIVYSYKKNDAVTINLDNSPTGIYTFSISTGTQVATKKIIMQ